MLLSRMAESGELERVLQGVYATPAAVANELVEVRALWLSLDPGRMAEERLRKRHRAGVLSHATAASLHGVGDLLDTQVEVTLPGRYQSRREGLLAHMGVLEPDEVTLVEGLPVTTAARTVADLVVAGHDRDHVATVMAESLRRGLADRAAVERALTRQMGDDADGVLDELLAAAGLDEASLTRQIAGTVVGERLVSAGVVQTLEELLAAYVAGGTTPAQASREPRVSDYLVPMLDLRYPADTSSLWRTVEAVRAAQPALAWPVSHEQDHQIEEPPDA